MKIALVSPYDYPYPGGVTEHIAHLEEQFVRHGHEVKIIAPSSSSMVQVEKENLYRLGSIVPIPANGSVARITLSLRLSGKVKQILREEAFDIVHLHEPMTPALPLTVLHHSKAVNIGTFHRYGGTHLMYYYGKPILKRFFNMLDGRIAVSEAALGFVSRHFPAKYIIIPNGIDQQHFGMHVRPMESLQDGKINILFVGRLEKRKGFSYLLRAYARMRRETDQVRLVVVGPYNEKSGRRYQSFVERHDLSDVLFVGYVSKEELARYYRTCDIFCAPSTGGESFGIILLEAMASSKPIVASNIDGYRGVLDHGSEGLLVKPKDDEALASALMGLLRDPEQRLEMGRRGLARAEQYSWEKVAGRILAYYGAVLHACGVPPEAIEQHRNAAVPPSARRFESSSANL
ncbi:MAG: glycosyltransferase family 4 protein [Dehalococcoidales bacterium]|nr:glycosyltransferase family 4 protein [Dehalococcoidales bacterium]